MPVATAELPRSPKTQMMRAARHPRGCRAALRVVTVASSFYSGRRNRCFTRVDCSQRPFRRSDHQLLEPGGFVTEELLGNLLAALGRSMCNFVHAIIPRHEAVVDQLAAKGGEILVCGFEDRVDLFFGVG